MIRDHQRAATAHAHVAAVAERAPAGSTERVAYASICHKLPILVHQAGLAPALHFVAQLSKGSKAALLDHLAVQLADAGLVRAHGGPPDRSHLLDAVRIADLAATQRLTRESQRCLDWYKRFAKTILKADPAADIGDSE